MANLTPKFTANFADQLTRAKAIGDGAPFYGVTVVLPKEHKFWKKLKKQLDSALEEKFGSRPKKVANWPIKDGDDPEYAEYRWDGCNFLQLKRSEDDGRPQIIDLSGDDVIDRSEVYSGMECRCSYRIAAWFHQPTNRRGVSVYLDNVQKTADGERIGRKAAKACDDFADFLDDDDEDDDSPLG
jgi:hypothetical protein